MLIILSASARPAAYWAKTTARPQSLPICSTRRTQAPNPEVSPLRDDPNFRRCTRADLREIDRDLRGLLPRPQPPTTSARVPAPRRRTHRTQARGHDPPDAEGDSDSDSPPRPLRPVEYPALETWSPDPFDDQWDTPAPPICAQPAPAPCQQQDPQDPVPEYQAAPSGYPSEEVWPNTPLYRAVSEDTLGIWAAAKRWANEIAHDVQRFDPILSLKIGQCQTWLRFRWTTDGKPAVWNTHRCGKRICSICLLARSKSLRRRVDLFALELVGGEHGDLFATFSGRGDWEQYTEALQTLRQRKPWRKRISGAAFGRHISPSAGRIHLHAYIEGSASPDLLAQWWESAARSAGITHARAHVEAVCNPPAAISYLLRPVQISGVRSDLLAEMHQQLFKKQTYGFTGTFAEYWSEAKKQADLERPPFKDNSSPLSYLWDTAGRTYHKTRFLIE